MSLLISSIFFFSGSADPPHPHSFPTRRSSDLPYSQDTTAMSCCGCRSPKKLISIVSPNCAHQMADRSEEHTSELQSRGHLVCRLLLEKKKGRAKYLKLLYQLKIPDTLLVPT